MSGVKASSVLKGRFIVLRPADIFRLVFVLGACYKFKNQDLTPIHIKNK